MSSINFIIGNTYTKLNNSRAKLDKSGNFRRIHDWTLYVDIIGNDGDLVKKVEFNMAALDPSKYVSHCPIKVSGSNGNRWRFQTRQQTYGPVSCKIAIIGRGGTVYRKDYRVKLIPGGAANPISSFVEHHPNKPLTPVKMENVNFGTELELSTSSYVSSFDVANAIQNKAGGNIIVRDMTHDYGAARATNHVWKVMTDASLSCSIDNPDCNKMELVSPILKGGDGLGEVDRVVRALSNVETIKVNASMGYHVHVDVSNLSLSELKKVCQNFVKYEAVMDTLMPPSRRTGGRGSKWCQSNRSAIGGSNPSMHRIIDACTTVQQLGNTMSPTKYYKLNMQPLLSGRQPTIEFRQHSSTYTKEKVMNWVRFCVAFVSNSARLKAPSFSSNANTEELFNMMFMYVVKDRCLRDYYRQRRIEVSTQDDCCDGCASGSSCAGKSNTVYRVGYANVRY